MTQPGAVVDMVVANDGSLELLGKVVLFIEDFAAAKHSDTFSAVFTRDLHQSLGGKLDGVIPGDQFQFVRFADIGLLQTLFMIEKLVHRKAFDAQISGIQLCIPAGCTAFNRSSFSSKDSSRLQPTPQ